MAVQLKGGKVLLNGDGKVAVGTDCCCQNCDQYFPTREFGSVFGSNSNCNLDAFCTGFDEPRLCPPTCCPPSGFANYESVTCETDGYSTALGNASRHAFIQTGGFVYFPPLLPIFSEVHAWNSARNYQAGDIVPGWQAVAGNTNVTPGSDLPPSWSNATTYNQNDEVYYGGLTYFSVQDSNTNNTPIFSPDWWQQYNFNYTTWKPADVSPAAYGPWQYAKHTGGLFTVAFANRTIRMRFPSDALNQWEVWRFRNYSGTGDPDLNGITHGIGAVAAGRTIGQGHVGDLTFPNTGWIEFPTSGNLDPGEPTDGESRADWLAVISTFLTCP